MRVALIDDDYFRSFQKSNKSISGSRSSLIKTIYALKCETMSICVSSCPGGLTVIVYLHDLNNVKKLYMSLSSLVKLQALSVLKHKRNVFST